MGPYRIIIYQAGHFQKSRVVCGKYKIMTEIAKKIKFEITIYGTNDDHDGHDDSRSTLRRNLDRWPALDPKLVLPSPKYPYIGMCQQKFRVYVIIDSAS